MYLGSEKEQVDEWRTESSVGFKNGPVQPPNQSPTAGSRDAAEAEGR